MLLRIDYSYNLKRSLLLDWLPFISHLIANLSLLSFWPTICPFDINPNAALIRVTRLKNIWKAILDHKLFQKGKMLKDNFLKYLYKNSRISDVSLNFSKVSLNGCYFFSIKNGQISKPYIKWQTVSKKEKIGLFGSSKKSPIVTQALVPFFLTTWTSLKM